jgi:hypothetical protein
MLRPMKKFISIYIPALHRELAPVTPPGTVLFMDPGFLQGPADAPGTFRAANLPFTGPAARAVLREMLELGSSLSPEGELRTIENSARAAAARSGAMQAAEARALESFAGGGQLSAAVAEQSAPRTELDQAELIRAQKILLLAWELEENLLDIKKAEAALDAQDRMLLSVLHGPEDHANNPAAGGKAALLLAWQFILEAAAPFLPEDALLFTASPELREALTALSPPAALPRQWAETLADEPAFTPLLPQLTLVRARLDDLAGGGKAASHPRLAEVYNFVLLPR